MILKNLISLKLALVFFIVSIDKAYSQSCTLQCLNGGLCVTFNSLQYCACIGSFTGTYCEISVTTTTPPCNLSCQNGKL